MWYIQPVTMALLGIIAWEDLRMRAIHWWLLPLLAVCMLVHAWFNVPVGEALPHVVFNLTFLFLQLAATFLLVLLKHRKWVNPLEAYIGLGDVLFFVVLALGLPRTHFILLMLTGLAFCIPAYFLLVRLFPRTERTIPTAGFLALYLMGWSALGLLGITPTTVTGSMAEYLLARVG